MAQRVRADPEPRAAGGHVLPNQLVDAPGRQPAPQVIEKQRLAFPPPRARRGGLTPWGLTPPARYRGLTPWQTPWGQTPAVGEPGAEGGGGGRVEWDDPLLPPLAEDADDAAGQVHVIEVETNQLAEAQAGGVEQFEDGLVAPAERRRRVRLFEQCGHFVDFQVRRDALLAPGRADEGGRVVVEDAFAAEKAAERANGRQFPRR